MIVGNYNFHRRAYMAFVQLAPEDQKKLLESLEALADTPVQEWLEGSARRLGDDPSLYIVPVDESLRVVVQAEEKSLMVLDIVRQETIDFFTRSAVHSDH
jgi:hypothetical protein